METKVKKGDVTAAQMYSGLSEDDWVTSSTLKKDKTVGQERVSWAHLEGTDIRKAS